MQYEREKEQLKRLLGSSYDTLRDYECILAGGAITSLFTRKDINDFDIYFRSKELLADFLYGEMERRWVTAHTDKSILFSVEGKPIQAIAFRYFASAYEIFESFDFTVCMGAFDFKTEEFVFHPDFFTHNAQRILVFNENTAFPIISGLRVDKYKQKGYYISKTEFIRILLTVNNQKIEDYDTLIRQIGGMYGERYDNWIEQKDKFSMPGVISDLKSVEPGSEKAVVSEIGNWDEFVFDITGIRPKAIEFRGLTYYVRGRNIELYYGDKSKLDFVDINSIINAPLYFFKYVRKTEDGRYFSFYDNNFEYKLGETVVARNREGLFCVHDDEINHAQYCNDKGAVLIRLRVDELDDIITFHNVLESTVQVKKAVFEEVLSDPNPENTSELPY
jgi:hypothetical protein